MVLIQNGLEVTPSTKDSIDISFIDISFSQGLQDDSFKTPLGNSSQKVETKRERGASSIFVERGFVAVSWKEVISTSRWT